MTVRIKEGMIPYKGGDGIEITNNHIINVLLREANNLIHMNENRELYVDLQLDDGIAPDDDFPVGVTTGKILAEDGWQQSGLILNWKTTSGDYARLIYANDGNLYVDLGDGVWILLGGGGADFGNVKAFYVDNLSETTVGQAVVDWYLAGKYPIVIYNDESYILESEPSDSQIRFYGMHSTINHFLNRGYSNVSRYEIYAGWDSGGTFTGWLFNETAVSPKVLATDQDYSVVYTPLYNGSPATKYYVDQGLALKQDILTAGNNITIQNNVISANLANIYTYRGSVPTSADLPTSGQSVGDVWEAQDTGISYAWNGTGWISMGTTYNLSDYFNKVQDDSDDITEGSIHLFCTSIEKNYWNSKQDALTAGNGIDLNNNVISAKYTGGSSISIDSNFAINNDAPFEPDNAGVLGQLLQKTSNGYEWRDFPTVVNSVNGQSGPVTVDEFDPENAGTTGQVLQKTATGYEWANNTASQYISGHGTNVNQTTREITNTLPFEPTNTGRAGQVIKLNQDGVTYSWQNDESGGGGGGGGTTYYGGDYITIDSSHYINNDAPFVPTAGGSTGQVLTKTSGGYTWDDIELPSGENNVKFWKINSQGMLSSSLEPIFQWVNSNDNNGAILNDSYTKDAFIFHKMETRNGNLTAVFLGKKRNSEATLGTKGYYTSQWEWELTITYANGGYSISCNKSEDDATKTNYISALPSGYDASDAFMPTELYEPATKKYVDIAVASAGGGDVSGPSSAVNGNLAVFDGTTGKLLKDGGAIPVPTVVSGVSGTTYTIQVGNSDPTSGTPATTITFVL